MPSMINRSQLKKKGNKYLLHGNHGAIDVYHSEQYSTLTIKGSLELFLTGHNLSYSKKEFEISVDQISTTSGNERVKDLKSSMLIAYNINLFALVHIPLI